MQNAVSDPLRSQLRPAVLGLALTMLVAAPPAAADDIEAVAPAFGDFASARPARPKEERRGVWPRWPVWPTAVELRLGRSPTDQPTTPVGLAVRLSDGVTLGTVGGFDPESGGLIGVISLDLAF